MKKLLLFIVLALSLCTFGQKTKFALPDTYSFDDNFIISESGKFLITASNNLIFFWEIETGKLSNTIILGNRFFGIRGLYFDESSGILGVTFSENGTYFYRSTNNEEFIGGLKIKNTLFRNRNYLSHVSFSNDFSKSVLYGENFFQLYDVSLNNENKHEIKHLFRKNKSTNKRIKKHLKELQLEYYADYVGSFFLETLKKNIPNEETICFLFTDSLRVFDGKDGKFLRSFPANDYYGGHDLDDYQKIIDNTGTTYLNFINQGVLEVYSSKSINPTIIKSGRESFYEHVITKDGTKVLTLEDDNFLRVWNVINGELLSEYSQANILSRGYIDDAYIVLSDDGKYCFVVNPYGLNLLNLNTGERIYSKEYEEYSLFKTTKDLKYFSLHNDNTQQLTLYDGITGEKMFKTPPLDFGWIYSNLDDTKVEYLVRKETEIAYGIVEVDSIEISFPISPCRSSNNFHFYDFSIYNTNTFEKQASIGRRNSHSGGIDTIKLNNDSQIKFGVFSNDGLKFASAFKTEIRVWDVHNGSLLHKLTPSLVKEMDSISIRNIMFSPDGAHLVLNYSGINIDDTTYDGTSYQYVKAIECWSMEKDQQKNYLEVETSPSNIFFIDENTLLFDDNKGCGYFQIKDNIAWKYDINYIVDSDMNSHSGQYINLDSDGWLRIFNVEDISKKRGLKAEKVLFCGGGRDMYKVSFIGNSDYVIVGGNGNFEIWNTNQDYDDEAVLSYHTLNGDINQWIWIAPDGRFDASAQAMEHLYFLDEFKDLNKQEYIDKFRVPDLMNQILNQK